MAEHNITIVITENKTVGQCRALYLQCNEQNDNPLSSGSIVVRFTFERCIFQNTNGELRPISIDVFPSV